MWLKNLFTKRSKFFQKGFADNKRPSDETNSWEQRRTEACSYFRRDSLNKPESEGLRVANVGSRQTYQ